MKRTFVLKSEWLIMVLIYLCFKIWNQQNYLVINLHFISYIEVILLLGKWHKLINFKTTNFEILNEYKWKSELFMR